MILVDSSAFIEYYRREGNPAVRKQVAKAIARDQVLVNGIVLVEVASFARKEQEFKAIYLDFKAFHWLDLTREDFDAATSIGQVLVRKGLVVPASDLVIAASCIRAKATLYHVDDHFDLVSRHTDLKSKNLA